MSESRNNAALSTETTQCYTERSVPVCGKVTAYQLGTVY